MSIRPAVLRVVTLAAALAVAPAARAAHDEHHSGPFAGVKADRGSVVHRVERGQHVLELSDDFKVPEAPDPHWQLVDARGTTFLLDRLVVKPGETLKRRIVVPAYVADVAKVQMWCAYAEVLLGEASFEKPVATRVAAAPRAAAPELLARVGH